MIGYKRLQHLCHPGAVLVQIKSRDCRSDLVPGRLWLQGCFDSMSKERIGEGGTMHGPGPCPRKDRPWVFCREWGVLPGNIGDLTIGDAGGGLCWGCKKRVR